MESLRAGLALGADGIEFDVRLSQDGHVMVIHDPRVDRTTNGTGEVRALSRDELQTLDAGYRFRHPDLASAFHFVLGGATAAAS